MDVQRLARLGRQDLANLLIEAPDTPMHMGVLMLVDGRPRLDAEGRLDQPEIVRLVAERVAELPELRQVARGARLLGGRPVWVDDPAFDVADHVLFERVPAPGGEREVLAAAERLVARRLPRGRPLWEICFLTGLRGGRVAVLLKVHHAVTDGLGMLRIADVLFDPGPRPSRKLRSTWRTGPPPTWRRLALDQGRRAGALGLDLARALARPRALARGVLGVASTLASASVAGRRRVTGLNRPIGPTRRLAVVRLGLDAVRGVAHAHRATVNDVLLALTSAGVETVLRERGREIAGRRLNVLLAVNPARPGAPLARRNQAGSVLVGLPLGAAGMEERLAAVSAASGQARRRQRYGVVEGLFVLGVLARAGRALSRRQTLVQLAVSNLVGPPLPLYLFGCPLEDLVGITPISGSVTLDFCALSYAGRFNIGILADARSWPDLDRLAAAIEAAWRSLGASAEPGARAAIEPAAVQAR